MTPKEKAKELVDNFRLNVLDYEGSSLNSFKAKQCALIAVDEIIDANPYECDAIEILHSNISYWQEVKQEIGKL
jgi:hypothetical protein